jgi:hypothetical protein
MSTEICRHIRTSGARCGSPALSGRTFCYYHVNAAQRHNSLVPRRADDEIPTIIHPLNTDENRQREPLVAEYFSPARGPIALDFPPLEDRESIQLALSMLITAMAQGRIDPKRASTMLYGLQVASANARGLRLQPSRSSIVRETVLDDDSGIAIAPDEDSEAELNYQQMLADVLDPQDDDEEDEDEDDD